MPDSLTPFDIATGAGLALAMSIFMGLAFEGVYKQEERSCPGGIRTFPLLAGLGVVLYLLEPVSLLPFLLGLAALGLWLYAYIRTASHDTMPGLVIPGTNLLAYCFGPLALRQPAWIVVASAVIAVLLLEGREALHRLVSRVASEEVFTLGKFLILIGVVLPLLPNHPVVSWSPITPFAAWLALVAISSLSYASYLLQRYLPAKSGALLPAILGGAYSSTATTVALARQHKASALADNSLAAGIIVATSIMYVRIAAVVAIFNLHLALVLLPALAGLFAVAGIIAGSLWRFRASAPAGTAAKLTAPNPLQLGTATTFAVLFVLLAAASSWVRSTFGQRGIYALAGLAGLTDIDPFVLSLTQGGVVGMPPRAIAAAILVAASANNVLKAGYAMTFGGVRACLLPALVLLALAAGGFAAAIFY